MRLRSYLHLKSTNRNCWIGQIWKNEIVYILGQHMESHIIYTLLCFLLPVSIGMLVHIYWSCHWNKVNSLRAGGADICASETGHHFIICSSNDSSRVWCLLLLNHRWLIVNWTLRILQKIFNQFGKFSFKNMHLMTLSAKWMDYYPHCHGLKPSIS